MKHPARKLANRTQMDLLVVQYAKWQHLQGPERVQRAIEILRIMNGIPANPAYVGQLESMSRYLLRSISRYQARGVGGATPIKPLTARTDPPHPH